MKGAIGHVVRIHYPSKRSNEESNDDESDVESKGGDPKTHDLGSCGEDGDVVEVPETLFEEERHSNDIPVEENTNPKENHSEDLFGIYSLLNKKKATIGEDGPSDQSPIYPPGFTPAATTNEPCTNAENADNVNCSHQEGLFTSVADHNAGPVRNSASQESMRDASESVCSSHFKKSVALRTGEGGLSQKAKKDWVKEICIKHKVNFLALQETKMKTMDVFIVKMCWGNLGFDYVHSDSVGLWLKTDNNLLIVLVYAPHDMKEKRMLWDYLTHGVAPGNNLNPLCSMAMKLKFLKLKIKEWNQRNMKDLKSGETKSEVVNSLQEIDKLQTMEIAQKAKIK
ncbi:RNA-directed DNA polymerase, eukaryota [Tanacetum coccineum]